MKIISLGGVGGCVIPQAIQLIVSNQERFPYDWLLANQSFGMITIMNSRTFFNFDDETKFHNNTEFSIDTLDAMSIHDFLNYEHYISHRNIIKEQYSRRINRFNQCLESNEPILFVRISNNTPTHTNWIGNFTSIPDKIPLWFEFIKAMEKHYKKPIYFLLVTELKSEYDEIKDKFSNENDKRSSDYHKNNMEQFYLRHYDNSHVNGNEENIQEFSKVINEVNVLITIS